MSPAIRYLWFLVFYVFTKAWMHLLYAHQGERSGVFAILA